MPVVVTLPSTLNAPVTLVSPVKSAVVPVIPALAFNAALAVTAPEKVAVVAVIP